MAEALVTLTLKDAITQQLRGVQREMQNTSAIAKAMGQSLEAKQLAGVAKQLGEMANNVGETGKNLSAAETAAKKATGGFKDLGGALSAFTKGAGGGGVLALFGGLTAAAAVLGGMVANAVKLAIEFNKISTGSVYAMSASGSLNANMAAFNRSAMGMSDLGINAISAGRMMSTYGAGTGRADYASQGRSLGEWAVAYGQDPNDLAQRTTGIAQMTGESVDTSMSRTFGAAAGMGDAGRRIPEVLSNLTDVLTKMTSSSPDAQVSTRDALREVLGATQGRNTSSAAIQTRLSAFNKLGDASSNPAVMQLEAAAGWSFNDIQLGTQDVNKKNDLLKSIYRTRNRSSFNATMMGTFGMSGPETRALYDVASTHGGSFLSALEPQKGSGVLSAAQAKAEEQRKDAAFKASPEGKRQAFMAGLENTEIDAGKKIIDVIAPNTDKIVGLLSIIATVMGVQQIAGGVAKIAGKAGEHLLGGAERAAEKAAADAAKKTATEAAKKAAEAAAEHGGGNILSRGLNWLGSIGKGVGKSALSMFGGTASGLGDAAGSVGHAALSSVQKIASGFTSMAKGAASTAEKIAMGAVSGAAKALESPILEAFAAAGLKLASVLGLVFGGVLDVLTSVISYQTPAGNENEEHVARSMDNAQAARGLKGAKGNAAKRDAISALWIKAGGDPKLAHVMGDVAMNESGGDPNQVNSIGAAGLMQIYGHGKGNWLDPMTNMREAVALSKSSVAGGFSPLRPWEDSRTKGGFGGWGSARSAQELDDAHYGQSVTTHRTPTHDIKVSVAVTPKSPRKLTGGTNRAL